MGQERRCKAWYARDVFTLTSLDSLFHNLRLTSTTPVEFRKKRFSFITNVENERVYMNRDE